MDLSGYILIYLLVGVILAERCDNLNKTTKGSQLPGLTWLLILLLWPIFLPIAIVIYGVKKFYGNQR